MQRNSWDKQYPALKKILLMAYNAEKKNLTVREISISGYMMTSLIIASWTFEEKSVFATGRLNVGR